MNKLPIILITLLISLIFGCTFNRTKLNKTQTLISERVKELNSAAKISADKTKIDLIKTESALAQTNVFDAKLTLGVAQQSHGLTLDFLDRNELLLGKPLEDQKNSVNKLLSTNTTIQISEVKAQEKKEKQEENWKQIEEERKSNLIKLGIQKEQENNKGIIKRVWAWSIGTFGFLGGVAFLVFCPAIAIPLLGRLLGFIIEFIPKLASFVGVVSQKVLNGVVKGVGQVRNDLKKVKEIDSNKTYTAAEVLKMLDTELYKATDQSHRNIIQIIRDKEKV